MKKAILLLLPVLLTGCQTTQPLPVQRPSMTPVIKQVEKLRIDTVKLVEYVKIEDRAKVSALLQQIDAVSIELRLAEARIGDLVKIAETNQASALEYREKFDHAEASISKWRKMSFIFGGILLAQVLAVVGYLYLKTMRPF